MAIPVSHRAGSNRKGLHFRIQQASCALKKDKVRDYSLKITFPVLFKLILKMIITAGIGGFFPYFRYTIDIPSIYQHYPKDILNRPKYIEGIAKVYPGLLLVAQVKDRRNPILPDSPEFRDNSLQFIQITKFRAG